MRFRSELKENESNLLRLGWSMVLLLLAFAVVYSRERLYGDSAIYLMWMAQTEDFQILHLRPSSYFTQWLPLLGMKCGASMYTVILLHSLSEWLLVAGVFAVLAHGMRQTRLGVAMLLAFLVGSRWNYFNPVSELLTGLPFFFLLFALLLTERKTVWTWGLSVALMVFSLFNHMLFSLMVPLFGAFLWLTGRIQNRVFWIGLGVTVIAAVVHMMVMDSYDSASIKADESIRQGLERIMKFGFANFLKHELKFKWAAFVMGAAVLWALWRQKKHLAGLMFLGSTSGLTLLVVFKYGGYFPETYEPFERYLFPVTVFAVFAFIVVRPIQRTRWEVLFLAFVALFQLSALQRYGKFVAKRYDLFDYALDYTMSRDVPKMAFRAENYYTDPLGHNWTMMNESVLLSAAEYDRKTAQVFVYEYFSPGEIDQMPEDEILWAPYAGWTLNIDSLNPRYFKMAKGPLLMANTDSIQRHRGEEWFNNIRLEVGKAERPKPGAMTRITLTVFNQNQIPLTSGMRKERIVLYTAWRDDSGNRQLHTETALMADVHNKMTQPVKMQLPPADSNWTFEAGLLLADSLLVPLKYTEMD